ncbi:hypothetical protein LCGC14_2884280, partial [marine sediment metagenome]
VIAGPRLHVLDGETGELLRTLQHPARNWNGAISMVAVGDHILIGSPSVDLNRDTSTWVGRAYLLDGLTGEVLRTFENPDTQAGYEFGRLVAADNGQIVISQVSAAGGDLLTQSYVYHADSFSLETDAEGNYSFADVRPGTYRVREVLPPGFAQTQPGEERVYTVTVTSSLENPQLDFGNVPVPINAIPEASRDHYVLEEGTTLTVDGAGVLANDSDGDADALQAVLVNGTSRGRLSLNADGSFVYNPYAGYHGVDTFRYKAVDGLDESAFTTVTLVVERAHRGAAQGNIFDDRDGDGIRDADEGGLEDWTVVLERVGGHFENVLELSRPMAPFFDTDAGSFSPVAFFGDDILVGDEYDDTSGVDAGAVYLYDGATGEHLRTFANPTGRW